MSSETPDRVGDHYKLKIEVVSGRESGCKHDVLAEASALVCVGELADPKGNPPQETRMESTKRPEYELEMGLPRREN